MKNIYFFRHPTCSHNKLNYWCGRTDVDIIFNQCENDLKYALEQIKNLKIDIIYTSPLKRAKILADYISKNKKCSIVIDQRLIERNFGQLESKVTTLQDKITLADWKLNTNLYGVEKIQDMYDKRILPFMNDITKSKEQNILIVSHAWVYRLIKYFFNKDEKDLIHSAKNCQLYKFNF